MGTASTLLTESVGLGVEILVLNNQSTGRSTLQRGRPACACSEKRSSPVYVAVGVDCGGVGLLCS
jgi:hypothetical protein